MQFILQNLHWNMGNKILKETRLSWDFLLTGTISPWSPHAPTGGTPLAHGAVLVSEAVRTPGAIVASVSAAKEISNVAEGVRYNVTLSRHSVWPFPAACWENEEEIGSPALASGSPKSRAVSVRATCL